MTKQRRNKQEFIAHIESKLKDVAWMVHADVVRHCPVDTGRLRASIVVDKVESAYIIGTNVEYAKFVEAGTIFIRPRHFFQNASVRMERFLNKQFS